MLITKEEIRQARKETKELIKGTEYAKEFRKISKWVRNNLGGEVFIYSDFCPEFYKDRFYVMEIKEAFGYLYFFSVKPKVEELLKDIKEFMNE